jgi:3-methylcrotonyl-CoA carboxylase alpha subunit
VSLDRFEKILVANRGEIACRVFRSCARLGIRTVAVYSDADRNARHVRLADEAHWIGEAAARDSYLRADRIIEVAKDAGVQAIHPGYGFLSENAEFAEACTQAGIVFIGPPSEAIRVMGSKSAAKNLMEEAGVPLVTGYHGEDQGAGRLAEASDAIGYPVMIKASAGGGGKGMRIVRSADDFAAALESCRRESNAAFGDDRVLVERYLEHPRHIEIQVFADGHGNVVHLFERDCSVQRRHQKVLEEAPAPGLPPQQREAMGRAAVDAARAVGYVGAGTVEFIVAPDGEFFFMEMNTRLQVEHPVTEMITGHDLVEWQLRVAADQPLPSGQDDLAIRGHALEARIYAEDPERGFMPSVGRLLHVSFPEASDHVRVDTGVEQGDEISPHYDPMIAKLVVWDETRAAVLSRMRRLLGETRIVGVSSNVDFLSRLVSHDRFASGKFDTGLIGDDERRLLAPSGGPSVRARLCGALAILMSDAASVASPSIDPDSPWCTLGAWRLNGQARREISFSLGDDLSTVSVLYGAADFTLTVEGASHTVRGELDPDGRLDATIDGQRIVAWTVPDGDFLHIFLDGESSRLEIVDPLRRSSRQVDSLGGLHAPMPGTILSLLVEPGTDVTPGTPLLVLEAMKMEHTVKAPSAGRVNRFRYAVGDQVAEGAELVDFEAAD